ncbi:hypothetical protein Q75_09455 [Bacillus coahuilensis p1.1.43]|uniref:SCP domain-containing protein n=1 Tax=Bacillus coahuilensis p1.1.43 TaxID=1150625 RepID=A0A147K7M9_9BACI|nr:CAP domain-containing protein [Bacillus coahuilensis]KUP06151.1 hypothetical protein Q75_09455 [Bacillus coahuilensis p1.1.43]
MKKSIVGTMALAASLLVVQPSSQAGAEEIHQEKYKSMKVFGQEVDFSQKLSPSINVNQPFNQEQLKSSVEVKIDELKQQLKDRHIETYTSIKEKQTNQPLNEDVEQTEPNQDSTQQQNSEVVNSLKEPTTSEKNSSIEENTSIENSEAATSINAFEEKVIELTNVERAKYGLTELQLDESLSEVARAKSLDMQQNNYFSHTSPRYGSPFDMMKQFGVEYRSAGENIAMGQQTPEEVVKAWMNSEGHRQNILSENYTHIGVGYVEDGNYWTQLFIGK